MTLGKRARKRLAVMATLALAAATRTFAQTQTLYDNQSEYNRVIVREGEDGIRTMQFGTDGAIQTSIDVRNPTRLAESYTAAAMLGLALVPEPKRILLVGLGGGAMAIFLRHNYPDALIEIAELDPAVVEAARQWFFFQEDPKMQVHVGDGRALIERNSSTYDVIFMDAYGAKSIPYRLATREFLSTVRTRLTDRGVLVANVWGEHSNDRYYSMVRTYETVFGEMAVVHAPGGDNHIFLALAHKLGLSQQLLSRRAAAVEGRLSPQLALSAMVDAGYEGAPKLPTAKILLDADLPRN
jgi:spermidine synthase